MQPRKSNDISVTYRLVMVFEFCRGTEKGGKTVPEPAAFAVIASSMGWY
jgi:hypothetical protein